MIFTERNYNGSYSVYTHAPMFLFGILLRKKMIFRCGVFRYIIQRKEWMFFPTVWIQYMMTEDDMIKLHKYIEQLNSHNRIIHE